MPRPLNHVVSRSKGHPSYLLGLRPERYHSHFIVSFLQLQVPTRKAGGLLPAGLADHPDVFANRRAA